MSTRGYLVYADAKYMPLAEVLMDSIYRFSSLPIHLYTTPGTETKFASVSYIDEPNPKLAKIKCACESPFDETCFLDADTVATPDIEKVWDLFRDSVHPLFSVHPWALHRRVYQEAKQVADWLGVTPTMPFVHSVPALFGKMAHDWLVQAREAAAGLDQAGIPWGDEVLFNALLWKHGYTAHLPYVFIDYNMLGHWPLPFLGVHAQKHPELARCILYSMITAFPNFEKAAWA